MDHTKVLKRAWHILWHYKALWIFGIILALTGSSTSESSSYTMNRNYTSRDRWNLGRWGDFSLGVPEPLQEWNMGDEGRLLLNYNHRYDNLSLKRGDLILNYNPPFDLSLTLAPLQPGPGQPRVQTLRAQSGTVATVMIGTLILIGLALILGILGKVLRYVSRTSVILMVDNYEETGHKVGVRKGFRLGWSRTSWRLFLISLLTVLPVALLVLMLLGLAAVPLVLWGTGSRGAGVLGTVSSVGLFFVAIVVAIVLGVVLDLLKRFFFRACTLEELGVKDSIRRGFAVVKRNFTQVVLMWLIMVGISIGWTMVTIPVAIVFGILGALVGGGAGYAGFALGQSVFRLGAPWILGVIVGLPIFLAVLALPVSFVGGLREVFQSSTWTLTYRELVALESLKPEAEPVAA